MTHRTDVARYEGALRDLAAEVGDLRYDGLAAFLRAPSAKLGDDGAANLVEAGNELADAASAIDRAWQISAPRMELGGEGP